MLPSLILQIFLLPSLSLAVLNERHLLRRQDDCPIGEKLCDDSCILIGTFCCYRGTGESCPIGSFCCSKGCCPNSDLDVTTFTIPATATATTKTTYPKTTAASEATSTSVQTSTTASTSTQK